MKPAIDPVSRMRPCPRLRMARPTSCTRYTVPGHVGVDHVTHVRKVLIEKRTAQAMARVGEECIDGSACSRSPQPIDAINRRQIGFNAR